MSKGLKRQAVREDKSVVEIVLRRTKLNKALPGLGTLAAIDYLNRSKK